MNYLNPVLYGLLHSRFGEVRVANEGDELVGSYKEHPFRDGRLVLDVEAWGETYCVNCPYCYETRHRLCVNHRYGTWDDIAKTNNTQMVRCFNEECFKKDSGLYKDLYDRVFGMMNVADRQNVRYLSGRKPVTTWKELREAPPPGSVVSLHELGANHPAVNYLRERGYDVQQLIDRYQLMYCTSAHRDYALAQGRIIIPIVQDNMWVGWQARYVGDLDWKLMRIPKYYTLPAMPKRLVLYNHDTAVKQDMVVITEGPTSCWSVYPYGVAILGKQASIQQQRLLINKFGKEGKPMVILLDGNAGGDSERLYNQLKPYARAGLLNVKLPPDEDPGNYVGRTEVLWSIIHTQAKGGSIILPGQERGNYAEDREAATAGCRAIACNVP